MKISVEEARRIINYCFIIDRIWLQGSLGIFGNLYAVLWCIFYFDFQAQKSKHHHEVNTQPRDSVLVMFGVLV